TTSCRTDADFWQAASSCMVPMTFISFIDARPPAARGTAVMLRCTTVSTAAVAITLAISGLRMSARTNSVRPSGSSRGGGTVSTPMIRSIEGSSASSAASLPPRWRLTPVTRTTDGGTVAPPHVRERKWYRRRPGRARALARRPVDDRDLGRGLAEVPVHPAEHHRLARGGPQRPVGAAAVHRDRDRAERVLADHRAPARHLAEGERERHLRGPAAAAQLDQVAELDPGRLQVAAAHVEREVAEVVDHPDLAVHVVAVHLGLADPRLDQRVGVEPRADLGQRDAAGQVRGDRGEHVPAAEGA